MKLRREATPPAPRCRSSWDPIAVILVLLLSAVAFGSLYEQRRLQARAEAAEADLEFMRAMDRAERLGRQVDEALERVREIRRQDPGIPPGPVGDFPPHPAPPGTPPVPLR